MAAERRVASPSGTGGTAELTHVRVNNSANSTFAGKELKVVRIEVRAGRTSYLCEMPGYGFPGWFRDSEVDHAR